MRRGPITAWVIVSCFGLSGARSEAAPAARTSSVTKTLYAHPVGSGRIQVDGRLDEPEWAEAPVGGDFVERVPTPGAKPPVRTEIRMLLGDGRLYVGVTAYITRGTSPRALELQRDSFGVFSDEALTLKFDVRHDTRTTVGFATNPAGMQLDYVAVENGRAFRREFDAIWNVATQIFEDRWVAEFELPAVALGLPDQRSDAPRVVGLNVTRDHNARLATYDWSALPPEFGPTAALFYGDLYGLDTLGGGRPLSLIPYVLGAYASDTDEFRARAGGDLRLRLGEDIWGELTVLTDFAQVDLDDPVLNLDRFALFFPERRPFFLSGLEFYEFGASGEAQLYFSRRIGLDESFQAIDLLGGAKTYGTAGDLRVGALASITGATETHPAQSFSVARIRQNFGENGHLGAIGTLRTDVGLFNDQDTPVAPHISLGVDGALRGFDRRLEATGFASITLTPDDGPEPRGFSGQGILRWRGYWVQPELSVLAVSPDFDPAVGFVQRRGQIAPKVRLPVVIRTTEFGLQSITVEVEGSLVRDYDSSELLRQTASAYMEVLLRSNFQLEAYLEAREDVVVEPADVAGLQVAPGRYRGYIAFVGLATPSGRNPSASIGYTRNTAFFGGVSDLLEASLEARLGPSFRVNAGGSLAFLDVPSQEDLETRVTVNASGSWTPNTQVQLDLIGQTNTVQDRATFLGRLRWRYLPGSDLFVVYRENLDYGEDTLRSERSLTVKLGFRYDTLL